MTRALTFLAKSLWHNFQKMSQFFLHTLPQKPKIVEMHKIHGVMMMPKLFLLQLCTALVQKNRQKRQVCAALW